MLFLGFLEKMAILYRGNVESIARDLAESQDVLDKAYEDILGPERAKRLRETAQRVLTPEAFFDSPDQVREYTGEEIPADAPSRMLFATKASLGLHPNGRIKDPNAKLSVGFYVSDESLRYSASADFTDRPLASYIHEFNHFAVLALQRTPLYLALAYMGAQVGNQVKSPEDIDKVIGRFDRDNVPVQRRRELIALATSSHALHDVWERSTRIFDKAILESIRIDVSLDWRGKRRSYVPMVVLNPYAILQVPVGGDPLLGLDDREAVGRVIEWEKYLQPIMKMPYVDNLRESLREANIELVPINQLSEEHNREVESAKAVTKKKKFKRRKRK